MVPLGEGTHQTGSTHPSVPAAPGKPRPVLGGTGIQRCPTGLYGGYTDRGRSGAGVRTGGGREDGRRAVCPTHTPYLWMPPLGAGSPAQAGEELLHRALCHAELRGADKGPLSARAYRGAAGQAGRMYRALT